MRLTTILPLLLSPTSIVHAYTPLSDTLLRSIPSPSQSDFDINPPPSNSDSTNTNPPLLAPLLIPRVPGTPGQVAAQQHFISFFTRHLPEWEILWQNSTQKAPVPNTHGAETQDLPFANIILRREPPWAAKKPHKQGSVGLLTLVAHYDSKVLEREGFVGATDSAAPCAVLMWVAREVERWLVKRWAKGEEGEKEGVGNEGVQILLLDGEEAFRSWTDEDSLYGAR